MLLETTLVYLWTAAALVTGGQVSEDVKNLADINTDFGLDVYKEVSKTSGNLFLSPYSISSALALTYQGARGQTKRDMEKALHFSSLQNLANLNPNFKSLIGAIFETGRNYTLKLANRLFGQKGKPFSESFLRDLQTYYGAPLEEVDFASDAEAARKHINAWVEKQTEETIKDLLPAGVIDGSTELVLANAIYFNGKWTQPFNASLTKDGVFYVSDSENVTVPMMTNTGKYGWYSRDPDLKGTLLRLPYVSEPPKAGEDQPKLGDVNMYLYLPAKDETLEEVDSTLTTEKLNNMIAQMGSGRSGMTIEITMPKFTITQHLSVKEILGTLGMASAFGSGADFSGMDGSKGLFLADVLHQAYVDVNEEGTTASGATAVILTKSAPLPITINRPFIFLIREEDTRSTLFLGRVKNPRTTNMARRSVDPAAGRGSLPHLEVSLILITATLFLVSLIKY